MRDDTRRHEYKLHHAQKTETKFIDAYHGLMGLIITSKKNNRALTIADGQIKVEHFPQRTGKDGKVKSELVISFPPKSGREITHGKIILSADPETKALQVIDRGGLEYKTVIEKTVDDAGRIQEREVSWYRLREILDAAPEGKQHSVLSPSREVGRYDASVRPGGAPGKGGNTMRLTGPKQG